MKVGLSHKVSNFGKLDIVCQAADGSILPFTVAPSKSTLSPKHREDITEVWEIAVATSATFELRIAQPKTGGRNLGAIETAYTIDGVRLFRMFEASVQVEPDGVKCTGFGGNGALENVDVLDSELTKLKELNSFEPGL